MESKQPAQAAEHPQQPDLDDSFEDDLGPNFDDMGDLLNMAPPENALGTTVEQVTRALDKYIQHPKGYVPLQSNLNFYNEKNDGEAYC